MKQDRSVFLKQSPSLPFVEIRQADRSSACYHAHSHDEFSFGVIDQGQARYRNLNQLLPVVQGDTVTINPGDTHSCNPDQVQWSYRMLFVDSQWVGELQKEWSGQHGQDYLPFHRHCEQRPELYRQFNRLYQALLDDSNPLASESLMIEYLSCLFEQPTHALPRQLGRIDPALQKVTEMLRDQLDANLSLDELANEAQMSRYQLIRAFNRRFGLSPHAYQLDQRIIKAKALLKSGLPLADTANSIGFADQAHFQRHFKKRIAITPKLYQSFFCHE